MSNNPRINANEFEDLNYPKMLKNDTLTINSKSYFFMKSKCMDALDMKICLYVKSGDQIMQFCFFLSFFTIFRLF